MKSVCWSKRKGGKKWKKDSESRPLSSSAEPITTMIEDEWMRHLFGVICNMNSIIISLVLCLHCTLFDLKQQEEKNKQKKSCVENKSLSDNNNWNTKQRVNAATKFNLILYTNAKETHSPMTHWLGDVRIEEWIITLMKKNKGVQI